MSFIDKIAKLITEDPDLFIEGDEDLRKMGREEVGDRDSYLAARRDSERRESHGTVSANEVMGFYTGLTGTPDEIADNIGADPDFKAEFASNRKEYKYALASKLMDYAPNFKRSAISRITNIIERWFDSEVDLSARKLDLHSLEINHPSVYMSELVEYHGMEGAMEIVQAYVEEATNRSYSLEARLRAFLGEEASPAEE